MRRREVGGMILEGLRLSLRVRGSFGKTLSKGERRTRLYIYRVCLAIVLRINCRSESEERDQSGGYCSPPREMMVP